MGKHDIINEVYLQKALYYYDFDMEDGIVHKDIIDKYGRNHTEALGLKSPCSFDELMNRAYDKDYYAVYHVTDAQINNVNLDELRKAYDSGKNVVEAYIYMPKTEEYHRISYYLIPDDDTGKPHAWISAMDITADEKSREVIYGNLRSEKSEIEDIVASARIGMWHIYLFEKQKPSMKGSSMMLQLMGVEDKDISGEELYEFWHKRIKRSSIPSVEASVEEMIESGFSENTYKWNHPVKGEIYVRCGGTAMKVEGKGVILRGYHGDVTSIVTSEAKQKQLLNEALLELKKQKKLLQEALDNYKEADYDRRRDFLTGLRNRQDMFEMLQDVLSGKRENIKAMFMMDIDNFKMLNDHYGHTYGDECLERIGDALNEYAKNNNIYFYRYGGEEILGISFSDKKDAAETATEIVKLIAKLNIVRGDMPTGVVTVSLGYTTDNSRYEKMIDKADTAMYKAKDNGKNQWVCFEDMN